jgi:serine/threonine-protein kinase
LNEEYIPSPAEPEADWLPLNIDVDWVAVGLGLLAVIAVGGLIPFWMWVYFNFNSTIK